mmetsp:Transcript_32236/g.74744  ORF Transcript_32236/g.74744 Transcript_32236/m.74744 type:complete len:157 (+) Transcript_32236:677-1147(+)
MVISHCQRLAACLISSALCRSQYQRLVQAVVFNPQLCSRPQHARTVRRCSRPDGTRCPAQLLVVSMFGLRLLVQQPLLALPWASSGGALGQGAAAAQRKRSCCPWRTSGGHRRGVQSLLGKPASRVSEHKGEPEFCSASLWQSISCSISQLDRKTK